MQYLKGKEDMGLGASIKLLNLPSDATIDDANQAYTHLHRMIDLFHKDGDAEDRGNRQEDMDLLTCAYEKALAYLSDREPRPGGAAKETLQSSTIGASESTDLHFTLNISTDAQKQQPLNDISPLSEPNSQTVENAISITTRRLQQTESTLPDAQRLVESAMAAAEAANQRHESAKQARMNAVVAAKSAKTMALLLEIEAKRAMDDAVAVAEKARERAAVARQTAKKAMAEADVAKALARRIRKSEETAAAELVCAEDLLEKEKARLKALTHTLVQTRHRMKMFQGTSSEPEVQQSTEHDHASSAMAADEFSAALSFDRQTASRQQIMSDLLEIEASLKGRKQKSMAAGEGDALADRAGQVHERRAHHRICYPSDQRPIISIGRRTLPILDLSTSGMRLKAPEGMTCPRIVRGAIAFAGRPPVKVTGKVIRHDDQSWGLKLVTRIGKHVLDQEHSRLSAVGNS